MATLHPSNPFYDPWCRSNGIKPESFNDANPKPSTKRSTTTPTQLSPSQSQSQSSFQFPSTPTFRTRSIGGPYSAGIIFERQVDLSPPNDDEIIIATVRVTDSFRRASIEGSTDLPLRPPRRNFLRRVSTRLAGSADANKYTAIKMPRRDYKRWFARDKDGNYVGTEPEREWTREDLDQDFARFQDMPLRSIPGASEYGEGDQWWGDSGKGQEERNDSVLG